MSTDAAFLLFIFSLIVCFTGEPDLLDAVISYLLTNPL
jgi:hypothetical protein